MPFSSMPTPEDIILGQEILDFIHQSPSAFHAAANVKSVLQDNGFIELRFEDSWQLQAGKKYLVTRNNSAVIAFTVGEGTPAKHGFHIIGTHTDSPGFRIKPSPELTAENRYLKLNVETYGGPILNTWLDRPLSLAGRVILRGASPFTPRMTLFNSTEPLLVIPNLAIHMNRKVNEGIELNKQKDLLPLLSMISEGLNQNNVLSDYIAENLDVPVADILDFDLFLYEYEKGNLVGLNREFISSGKLDDLAMVHAGTVALTTANNGLATNILACFDNEECGSSSKQGAASPLLSTVMERIMLALGCYRDEYFQALASSFLISADMAHSVHPNTSEKHDPTNRPILNCGPVIKLSANQSYTTDGESSAVFEELCRQVDVPVQKFVNRSDERGGSTIGPILANHLDIRSVDIGNPLLAMHSIRELGGIMDHASIIKVFRAFYETI